MAKESLFVERALTAANSALPAMFVAQRGAALLYQVTLDNELRLTVDPKHPKRGSSAFQTDVCVFEKRESEVLLPRVVLEFKTKVTTHDIITYSAKAQKHKQVYPYLRYGIVASDESSVPGRVFRHNEALDFFFAASGLSEDLLIEHFRMLLDRETEASKKLEAAAFETVPVRLFRSEIFFEHDNQRRRRSSRA